MVADIFEKIKIAKEENLKYESQIEQLKLEFETCKAQNAQCIDYRNSVQCDGDIVSETSEQATTEKSATYQSPEGYGKCASRCIGIPGAVSFNWIINSDGSATCECLRKVFLT